MITDRNQLKVDTERSKKLSRCLNDEPLQYVSTHYKVVQHIGIYKTSKTVKQAPRNLTLLLPLPSTDHDLPASP